MSELPRSSQYYAPMERRQRSTPPSGKQHLPQNPASSVVPGPEFLCVVPAVGDSVRYSANATAVAELQGWPPLGFEHTFPSGHVMGSAALLGMIAVCLGVGRSRAVKLALAVPLVNCILFVAFVTVYSEAHVFSDVIGGLILGGAIVSLGAGVLGATHYSRRDSAVALRVRVS